jgi:uncharacterized protein DUF3105
MSSRQQEKERRRQERLARERAAAAESERRRRMGIAAGGFLAVAAVAAVVIAVTAGGGGDKSSANPGKSDVSNVPIPAAKTLPLAQAAKAAACKVQSFPEEGRRHVLTAVKYKTNPPTSGNHNPTPAHDGIYSPGNTPAKEFLVHALEHGRVEIQYKAGTPRRVIGKLQSLVKEIQDSGNPRILLFQNDTAMPYQVAAAAWTHLLACPTYNDRALDAIRAFVKRYDLQAPETQYIGPE